MRLLTIFIKTCLLVAFVATIASGDAFAESGNKNDTIKIGLLVTDANARSAINGAQLALDKINQHETAGGHHFTVVVRSMEGTWGTGSIQTVNLIYNDKIWAVLGSHDGRNAHLVEQVIAKQHYVFLSAWATDPSLSQAFVPWYFSCVYNDLQQASSLVDEIYNIRKYNRIGVVSDEGYDSKLGMSCFEKIAKSEGKPAPVEFLYNSEKDIPDLTDKINRAGVECVIFFGKSQPTAGIISQMKDKNINIPAYGTLSVMSEGLSQDQANKDYKDVSVVTSAGWLDPSGAEFRNDYMKAFGYFPDAVAAYAYDGMNVLVTAIKNSNFDIDILKDAMMKVHYPGITGDISFDERGNRSGKPKIMELQNGIPVTVYH